MSNAPYQWDIFVSHASEDKSDFVRALVEELKARGVSVWYDEDSLKIGDKLRESLDKGLAQSRFGIVILSPSFFKKDWPGNELEGLLSLEKDGRKVILPIWHNVSAQEVKEYSSILAGRVAANTKDGVKQVAGKIIDAIGISDRRQVQISGGSSGPGFKIPVILAGCGWWARERTVLPLLKDNPDLFEIVGVTSLEKEESEFNDVVIPALSKVSTQVPLYYGNLSEAIHECRLSLGTERPLAVIINTPNRYHKELADHSLAAIDPCHVYAERPINRTSLELSKLVKMAYAKNRFMYNGVQRRLEAPYKYLFNVVENKKHFGEIASIRCVLASGREIEGWRRKRYFSGGGIVIDEGYHLLDAAIWIIEAAYPGTVFTSDKIRVLAHFEYDKNRKDIDVEIAAAGIAILPHNITLHFDLSYNVPVHSVYEMLELRDTEGNLVRLLRNQTDRTSEPSRIVHQLRGGRVTISGEVRGKVIGDGYIERQNEDTFFFVPENPTTGANNTGPLRQFLGQIRRFNNSVSVKELNQRIPGVNECDARFVLNTQELIAAIYDSIGDSGSSGFPGPVKP